MIVALGPMLFDLRARAVALQREPVQAPMLDCPIEPAFTGARAELLETQADELAAPGLEKHLVPPPVLVRREANTRGGLRFERTFIVSKDVVELRA